MQRHNIKNIVKQTEGLEKRMKRLETSAVILAASNLGLWGIIIINYFLQ